MGRILVALLFLLGIAACDQAELSGPPEKAKMKLIYSSSDAQKPVSFVIFQFDANGNTTKETHLEYPSTPTQYTTYEYEQGKLRYKRHHIRKEKSAAQYESELPLLTVTEYSYQQDLLAFEKLTEDGRTQSSKQYFYNEKKQLIRTNYLNANDEVTGYVEFEYDDESRLMKESDSGGTYILYHYENGLLVRSETHRQDGMLLSYMAYSYNNEGKLTEKLVNGIQLVQRNKYREKMLIEEIIYHPTFATSEWQVYRYKY